MELEFLGSGLGRTGTMSLKLALEQLTNAPCYHMAELLKDTSRLPILRKGIKTGKTDWQSFFEGYKSSTDYPACLSVKELLKINPKLKVIHTTRDPAEWYDSVFKTMYRVAPKGVKDNFRIVKNYILYKDFRSVVPVIMHTNKIIWKGQFKSRFSDKDFAIRVFLEHEKKIKRLVPKDQLLLFDVKDGWDPLCEFLNVPVPENAFPKTNRRHEFNYRMDKFLYEGKLIV